MAHIVHINTVADTFTGVGSVIATLAAEQRRMGLAVSVAAGYVRPRYGTFADYVISSAWRHRAAALEARLRANDGRLCHKATLRLIRWLESSGDVTALHLHNLHGYYIDAPTLLKWAWATRTKVVVTLHDHWWCSGRCAYIAKDCDTDCLNCRHRNAYPATWLPSGGNTADERMRRRDVARIMAATIADFVAPSQCIADLASERLDIPVRVIRNGIDSVIFDAKGRSCQPATALNVIAVAATWTRAKGGDILRAVASSLPENWHLTVVGKGAPVKASPHIRIIEYATPEALAALYREADVLLSTATDEAFGMTVAEALSCGTPAVVNAATATAELVAPGVNGFAINMAANAPTALIDALSRAASLCIPPPDISLSSSAMAHAYAPLYTLRVSDEADFRNFP